MNRLLLTLAAVALACTTPLEGDDAFAARIGLPVFPGAAGFGTTTIAGRGGRVLRVTNLDDDGPGSLRGALTASGPRVVIFEVSGIIDLHTPIYVGAPYLTVAGQTAPSPGIMVKGSPIVLYGHDMLVQHIASRPGSVFPPGEILNNRDAFVVSADPDAECYNIVLDHVSGSWSTDEILSTWSDGGAIHDVTIINSLFAEALGNAGHTDEATGTPESHSAGVLIGRNTRRVSFHRNAMAYNAWRNPLCRDNCTDIQIVNNFVYLSAAWDRISITSDGTERIPVNATVRGNVFIPDRDAGRQSVCGPCEYSPRARSEPLRQRQLVLQPQYRRRCALLGAYERRSLAGCRLFRAPGHHDSVEHGTVAVHATQCLAITYGDRCRELRFGSCRCTPG